MANQPTQKTTQQSAPQAAPQADQRLSQRPVQGAGPAPRRGAGRSRLAVVGVTASLAVAWWAVLVPVGDLTLTARQGGTQRIGAVAVLASSIAVSFAGWALLAVLERRTPRARDAWTVIATIVCVLSLGSPLMNGLGLGAKLGLASLHLIVGATVILGLRRTALSPAERR